MKRFMKSFFVALVIGALASLSALAGDKGKVEKKMVTFTGRRDGERHTGQGRVSMK